RLLFRSYHHPKDLAVSIAIESSELLERFQWRSPREVERLLQDAEYRRGVEEEMADVLIYLVALANRLKVDLPAAALAKLERNARKYPAEEFRGKAHRDQEKPGG
ncbi:MAG: nucleotide pyrophosphohydrolase, partial [Candidatus Thermoplasmatota archaeon]|nr:nucleotide pyrophosphohydrolase [Candidatus Thermoplasmatota archaeon]